MLILKYSISTIKYVSIALLLLLTACGSNSNEEVTLEKDKKPVVSVYNSTLYFSELNKAVPEGLNKADSTAAADAYIKKWINEELIYEKAKQNIVNQSQINQLVEDYRQSLTVYTYLEQLLKDALAKQTTEKELKDYYDKNSDNLKLENCLVKGLFLKVPLSSPELNNLKKWYQSNSADSREKIEKASIQNAVIYDYFYDKWVNLEDVTVNMPNTITDISQFVKNDKNFETSDSTYVYLLHIESFALPGTTAPFDYAKNQITDILINKSREQFLKQFEQDLYSAAEKKNNIKFYTKTDK